MPPAKLISINIPVWNAGQRAGRKMRELGRDANSFDLVRHFHRCDSLSHGGFQIGNGNRYVLPAFYIVLPRKQSVSANGLEAASDNLGPNRDR